MRSTKRCRLSNSTSYVFEVSLALNRNNQNTLYVLFRNLYFRTCYLLLINVTPVFVLEGKAPELKYDTIAERNAIQFKGARPKGPREVKTGKDRSRFHFVLKQCEEMLKLMGLTCIRGEGEAEALCAYLNADGVSGKLVCWDKNRVSRKFHLLIC